MHSQVVFDSSASDSLAESLLKFQQQLTRMHGWFTHSKIADGLLDSIQIVNDDLTNKLLADGDSIPDDYLRSIRSNTTFAFQMTDSDPLDRTILRLRHLLHDLRIKDAPDTGLGVAEELSKEVRITVQVRSASAKKGFQVFCNPALWDVTPHALYIFNGEDTMTRDLPPGEFIIWIERDSVVLMKKAFDVCSRCGNSRICTFNLK